MPRLTKPWVISLGPQRQEAHEGTRRSAERLALRLFLEGAGQYHAVEVRPWGLGDTPAVYRLDLGEHVAGKFSERRFFVDLPKRPTGGKGGKTKKGKRSR